MNLTTPAALAEKFGGNTTARRVIDWTRRYGWPHVKVGRTIAYTDADVELILATHHVDQRDADVAAMPGQTALSAKRAS